MRQPIPLSTGAETDETAALLRNVTGSGHIAQACEQDGAIMAYISTDYVFDGTSQRPYRPADSIRPVSVYGKSKLAGERAVLAAISRVLIVRTAGVYAAGGANFVTTMLRLMAAPDGLKMVADQFGTPTDPASLAQAI